MIRSTLLALCLVPGLAHAKKPTWFADGAGSVDISGAVEVDLVRLPTEGSAAPMVQATVAGGGEEEQVLFALTTLEVNQITSGLADALGLSKKAAKGFVVIPEVRIGELVLSDVRAKIGPTTHLGLSTLEGLEIAVLNSKGKVVFGGPGAGLVSQVGTGVSYSFGEQKWKEHGLEVETFGKVLQVPGTIAGTEGYFQLDGATAGGVSEVAIRGLGDMRSQRMEKTITVLDANLGGVSLGASDYTENGGLFSADNALLGIIASDQLYGFDYALDLDGMMFAVAPAKEVKWTDGRAFELEQAKLAFEEAAMDAEEGEDGAAVEDTDAEGQEGPDAGNGALAGRHSAYGHALMATDMKAALAQLKLAAEAGGDVCSFAQDYGQALVSQGDLKEGAAQLLKAAESYDAWWSQDREVRKSIEEGDEVAEAYTLAQPAACHTAWSYLAGTKLASGDTEGVTAIYEAHLDLDPNLAYVYGAALLGAEDFEGANGAFRKALNMGSHRDSSTRLGLGYANLKLERSVVFERQLEAIRGFDGGMSLTTGVLATRMAESAVDAAKVFADDRPNDAAAQLTLAYAMVQSGQADAAKPIIKKALELALADVDREAGTAASYGRLAVAYALSGDKKRAGIALSDLEKAGWSDSLDALTAEGFVRTIYGENDKAKALFTEANMRAPSGMLRVMLEQ